MHLRTDRAVLVTGQAAGFLNMMAEGMSCALHSDAIAGEAIVSCRPRRNACFSAGTE